MDNDEIRTVVREVLSEAHIGCPWEGMDSEKVKIIAKIPTGAFRFMHMMWSCFDSVGRMAGHAISIGLFALVLALIYFGGRFIFGLGSWFSGSRM